MKSYKVNMLNTSGKMVSEIFPADSFAEIQQAVKKRGMYLVDYQEIVMQEKERRKLNLKTLTVFCYQLGTMLSAGIPLILSLRMIQNKADNKRTLVVYQTLYEEVQKGNSLSVAMMSLQGMFPSLLINMVQAGEASGSVEKSLLSMSDHYEGDAKTRNKIKSAMMYPAILLVVAVSVVLVLVVFILPSILSNFTYDTLPLSTQIIMGFSNFLIHDWLQVLIGLAFIVGIILAALNISSSRLVIDRALLRLPVFGKLLRTIYSSRCARTFASLYSSGIKTLDMLKYTGMTIGNSYIDSCFEQVILEVSSGETISNSLGKLDIFDSMLISMISIGEESGSLDSLLNRAADYFTNEADSAITRMITMIEPIMMLVMGVMVAFIVISIMQPMFSMYGQVQ